MLHAAEGHQPEQREQREEQERGIGLRIDHAETFIAAFRRRRDGPCRRRRGRRRRWRPRETAADLDPLTVATTAADFHFAHRRQLVGTRGGRFDAEDVAEALAQEHRRLRQAQCRTSTELELSADEHAGAQDVGGGWRQIDIDQAVARLRVHARRHGPHPAVDDGAAGSLQPRRLTRPEERQLVGSDLGTPLEATAANQPKQLLSGLRQRTDGCGARADDAVVRRQHIGPGAPQFVGAQPRLCRMQPGQSRCRGGFALDPLLRAVEALLAQLFRAFVVGARLGQRRFGLGDRCLRLGQFAVYGFAVDARQDGALAHPITDVGAHLGDALVAQLGANDRLLPRGDVAAGRQRQRPVEPLRGDGADRQCRPGSRRLRRCRCLRLACSHRDRQDRRQKNDDWRLSALLHCLNKPLIWVSIPRGKGIVLSATGQHRCQTASTISKRRSRYHE
jgi:hypothetical protein